MENRDLAPALQRLLSGGSLDRGEAHAALDRVLAGCVPDAQVAAFLTLLQYRGPRAEELAGLADSLSAAAVPYPDDPGDGIDTCGTGGDGHGTFNVSTVAALVAAAAGATVLKHGNRAATSRSGSADLLEGLGIPVEQPPADAVRCARHHRFAFLYARQYHPVLAKVAPVRAGLGFPTVFNLLGPLLNPARVQRQLIGTYSPEAQELLAQALHLRGTRHALVLHGAGGLDEATPLGPFRVLVVRPGPGIREEQRDPRDLGVPRCRLEDLQVRSPEESVTIARTVLEGRPGPARDAVLLNAVLALEVAELANNGNEAMARAVDAIDRGAVRALVESLSGHPGERGRVPP